MERITGKTELIGLIATPIKHSNSPRMQNEAFAKVGADYCYLAFDVTPDKFPEAVAGLKALGARGFNISMPYKMEIIKYLDEVSPAAEMIGAVNTVINEGGKYIGHNTDGYGFCQALRMHNIDFSGKKAVLIGPGGAGTAISVQSALDGLGELIIYSRGGKTYPRAQQLVKMLNEKTTCKAYLRLMDDEEQMKQDILGSDLLINSTGIGMGAFEGQSVIKDESVFHEGLVVFDAIYSPPKTKLLEQAEAHGCRTIGGIDMLLWQGARCFELWTGKNFPMNEIRPMFVK